MEQLGVRAIGISGKDGGLLKVDKKLADGEDIGFVGDVKEVNADIIYDLLEKDFLPIIAPIGLDDDYNTYNINADDAACAIAKAINAEKLAFLTDIEGVYKDPKDPSTLISELNVSVEVCCRRYRTVSMRLRTEYQEYISWMEEFRIVCFLKSLQIKVSELQLKMI